MKHRHSMPFGAEALEGGGVRFRLWAPDARSVELHLEASPQMKAPLPMTAQGDGWYERVLAEAGPGTRYRFRIDGDLLVPDPASRHQPEGVHGPSEVIDPEAFEWDDAAWTGRPWNEAVFYELHVGTFTPGGTFRSACHRLNHLTELGVTAVELMPVADFPGRRNWGYDGVLPFAPARAYGRPDDLKHLVQEAHRRGLMVFLDVVYNHFGPEGNYLHTYARSAFFTTRYRTPWGAAINFDGPGSRTVRDFFIQNALYWLEEFRFDGLRLDAVHAIRDRSRPDFLEELAQAVRNGPGRHRRIHLVLENDDNAARYLQRDPEGRPVHYTAQWNDDIHHACHVLLTGETEGYYADYADEATRHLARCLAEGFAYQGEPSPYRGGRKRGEPSEHLPPEAFVSFLQNHDQVGNRAFGDRLQLLAEDRAIRAALAVVLLAPAPPLLFMGEEFGCRRPFPFFCDFGPELAANVTRGRRKEFERFPAFRDPAARAAIPDPNAEATFASAVLDWAEAETGGGRSRRDWIRRLLALRRDEIVPLLPLLGGRSGSIVGVSKTALAVRWRGDDGTTLALAANLGPDPAAALAPEATEPRFPDDPDSRPLFTFPEPDPEAPSAPVLGAWSVVWWKKPPR
ncbi:MAG: malto-oligosyltrehalose trehalohydrolase [Thermodesulfobacteriota bacterium]|nr:malto-oligosyltrehalose trehalohydrolase [Thermodesulfobacteriota bacterium]